MIGFNPGNPCCNIADCLIYEDNFEREELGDDWEVLEGDVSVSSGKMLFNGNGKVEFTPSALSVAIFSFKITADTDEVLLKITFGDTEPVFYTLLIRTGDSSGSNAKIKFDYLSDIVTDDIDTYGVPRVPGLGGSMVSRLLRTDVSLSTGNEITVTVYITASNMKSFVQLNSEEDFSLPYGSPLSSPWSLGNPKFEVVNNSGEFTIDDFKIWKWTYNVTTPTPADPSWPYLTTCPPGDIINCIWYPYPEDPEAAGNPFFQTFLTNDQDWFATVDFGAGGWTDVDSDSCDEVTGFIELETQRNDCYIFTSMYMSEDSDDRGLICHLDDGDFCGGPFPRYNGYNIKVEQRSTLSGYEATDVDDPYYGLGLQLHVNKHTLTVIVYRVINLCLGAGEQRQESLCQYVGYSFDDGTLPVNMTKVPDSEIHQGLNFCEFSQPPLNACDGELPETISIQFAQA